MTEHTITDLPVDDCMANLATHRYGRIAYTHAGGLELLPVNFAFHEGAVVIRLPYGDRVDLLAAGVAAAFEIDEIDERNGTGWSVVVHGLTEEVWSPDELARLRRVPLVTWAPGRREHYVRLLPARITGRLIAEKADQADDPARAGGRTADTSARE